MNKILFVTLVFGFLQTALSGQRQLAEQVFGTAYAESIQEYNSGAFKDYVSNKAFYVDKDNSALTLYLSSKMTSTNLSGRIDFFNEQVELDLGQGKRLYASLGDIDGVEVYRKTADRVDTTLYVSTSFLGVSGKPRLLEQLATTDEASIYHYRKVKYLKPNFNPALNTGSKEGRYVTKDEYYLYDGKKLKALKFGNQKKLKKMLQSHFKNVDNISELNEENLIQLNN